MKKFKIILLLLLSSQQLTYAQPSGTHLERSQQLAYQTAIKLIGTNDTYRYYVSQNTVRKDGENCWLVFVDKEPKAGWEHPCTYVYAKEGSRIIGDCTAVDSVCPPSDIRLTPVHKSNNVPEDTVKVKVAKGPENAFAANTYAVILSGGKNKNCNNARYWNDCSFIYQTLTKKYRVPKGNVKVLMSDGTDPAEDMCREVGDPYISSPLDLDDDGNPEIEYSATKANLRRVFSELSNELGDEDHLFVYVIDHGGYDYQKKSSYICLWNDEKLYPEELNSYLDGCEAGYISFVMGQCNSGGFSRELQANNRIIMTACGEDEVSYGSEDVKFDEFVYHWTRGINGADEYGVPIDNYKKNRTFVEAYTYACNADAYNQEFVGNIRETPTITLLRESTAEDLALDTIPDVVDLYITRGEIPTIENTVAAPKMFQDKIDVPPAVDIPEHITEFNYTEMMKTPYWDNSDVWVRHKNDGLTNFTHQGGCLSPDQDRVYIYVNVANRGVKAYDTGDCILKSFWARSAMKISTDAWLGKKTAMSNGVYGNTVDPVLIEETIQPGASVIKCLERDFKGIYLDYARKEDFNMCVLAYLTYDTLEGEPEFSDDALRIPAVWRTNKLAQKNQTTMSWEMESAPPVSSAVYVPYERNSNPLKICVIPSDETEDLFGSMKVNLTVPKGAVSKWEAAYDKTPAGPKAAMANSLTDIQLDESCRINNMVLSGKKGCAVKLTAVPNSSEDFWGSKDYKFSLALFDEKTGWLLGGQSYIIHRGPRKKIDFGIDKTLVSGNYVLEAKDVSEDVEYRWYDAEGKLIGTGATCTIPANAATGTYTLETTAVSDGAFAVKEVTVEHVSKIGSVRDAGNGMLEVSLTSPAAPQTSVGLSVSDGRVPVSVVSVDEGAERLQLPLHGMKKGVYSLVLMENGKAIDSASFSR